LLLDVPPLFFGGGGGGSSKLHDLSMFLSPSFQGLGVVLIILENIFGSWFKIDSSKAF